MLNTNAGKSDQRVWASENFAWRLLNHKKPEQLPSWYETPQNSLARLVHTCCPGYDEAVGKRWGVKSLLKGLAWNADLTFITAVWTLSAAVGQKAFPCGLYDWPTHDSYTPGASASSTSVCASSASISASSKGASESSKGDSANK